MSRTTLTDQRANEPQTLRESNGVSGTGETITSYKKAMKDPATAEIWQTAFGKEFGGMAQGNDKTKQKEQTPCS
jgi:hypothetical protein